MSNFGKKELTVCTIGSATRLTPETGGSSGYHPDNLAVGTAAALVLELSWRTRYGFGWSTCQCRPSDPLKRRFWVQAEEWVI